MAVENEQESLLRNPCGEPQGQGHHDDQVEDEHVDVHVMTKNKKNGNKKSQHMTTTRFYGYMDVKKHIILCIFLSTQAVRVHALQVPHQVVETATKRCPPIQRRHRYNHAAVRSNLFREDRRRRQRQHQHQVSTTEMELNLDYYEPSSSQRRLGRIIPPLMSNSGGAFRRKTTNRMKSPLSNRLGLGLRRGAGAARASSTALNMVFTTSSSLIEKISTKILLDDLIDESVRTAARNPVMMQFDPSSGWIWRRWKGTVFSETFGAFVMNICYASIIWIFFSINPREWLLQNLSGFNILWGQLLSVTTFTLTFFLNQSYSLWRSCYDYSRRLQGRLNDLNMTLAAHAARIEPNVDVKQQQAVNGDVNGNKGGSTTAATGAAAAATSTSTPAGRSAFHHLFANGEQSKSTNDDKNAIDDDNSENEGDLSMYTQGSRQVLELMARYTRVFNLLTYASFTGSHRPLLTPQGMRRLVDRGIITETERQVLSNAEVPVTQRHNILLLWIIRLFLDARKAGHIEGSDGFEQQFLEKVHVIRAQYGAIGDELAGRMPLAYAHIVQVLVDVILWMYPFMAFSQGMAPFLGIIGTGLLTMFYQGLFDLAKQFLDPYDNESYGKGDDPLCIDTLIAETNAGSVRWMHGLAEKPFAFQKIDHGDMQDYQLPLRGWTVEETFQREEEERIRQAQEEAERMLVKEEEPVPSPEDVASSDLNIELEKTVQVGDVEIQQDACDDLCKVNEEENLTMEEALEKMDECTEKVP